MLDSRYGLFVNNKMNGFAIVDKPACLCFVAIEMAKEKSFFAISICGKVTE